MLLSRLRPDVRHRVLSRKEVFATAAIAAFGTAAIAWAFHERAPRDQFLFLYMPMIGAVAYLGGRAPGYVAWGISMATVDYFIIPPTHSFVFGPAIVRLVLLFGSVAAVVVEGAARLRAAEAAAQHLALMVESSEDAIFSSAFDGTIRTWNHGAERLCGYPGVEVIGRPMTILPPPGQRPKFQELMARVRPGEHVGHFETVWVKKDGTSIDVSVAFSPVPDTAGRLGRTSVIAHDITERKRADRRQRLLLDASEALTSSLDIQARIDALARSVVPALARLLRRAPGRRRRRPAARNPRPQRGAQGKAGTTSLPFSGRMDARVEIDRADRLQIVSGCF